LYYILVSLIARRGWLPVIALSQEAPLVHWLSQGRSQKSGMGGVLQALKVRSMSSGVWGHAAPQKLFIRGHRISL